MQWYQFFSIKYVVRTLCMPMALLVSRENGNTSLWPAGPQVIRAIRKTGSRLWHSPGFTANLETGGYDLLPTSLQVRRRVFSGSAGIGGSVGIKIFAQMLGIPASICLSNSISETAGNSSQQAVENLPCPFLPHLPLPPPSAPVSARRNRVLHSKWESL